ncbi:MAG: diacylglycerol/lipid kinase family protein [Natronincolaceae bacterium]|nr:YegS/Rv2252/BmrU family lipid kinase [Bacillota bacterium]NLK90597.1 YegS/Rv2252/BmrU family lipid kinase [Clostridiales bacterium]
MKKIKIICNPNSGRQAVQKNIPGLVEILEENNYHIDVYTTKMQLDAMYVASRACKDKYDIIVAVGGDGTVNEVVNGVMPNKTRPKLAVYPAGTVNDFANYLKVPRTMKEFAEIIIKEKTTKIDVGLGGDRYFLNVAAAGLLTDVAYRVSSEAKTVLGKFAYYLGGLRELPRQMFKPIKITLKIGDVEEKREILFFLVANTPSVGGFKYVAPEADISDGKFDLLIVEKSQFIDVASIFFMALTGNHTSHPNLQYIQVDAFSVYCDDNIYVDLDGEQGGKLPMDFKVKKDAIDLIVPD